METPKIFDSEYRFACIVWAHEPVTTRELVQLCQEQLEWKRTTTYTVLKKFSKRGIFDNQNGTVIVRITKEEFYARQSECYVEHSFHGSLPGFVAAFTSRRKLSAKEIEELQQIIDQNK